MLYDCDTLIHVCCEHPDDSSMNYTFGIKSNDLANLEEVRKEIEKKVNRHNYWHEVKMWIEYHIEGKMYKSYF